MLERQRGFGAGALAVSHADLGPLAALRSGAGCPWARHRTCASPSSFLEDSSIYPTREVVRFRGVGQVCNSVWYAPKTKRVSGSYHLKFFLLENGENTEVI